MVRIAEQAEQNLSQEDKIKLRLEEKKKVAARKTTSWRVWRNTTEQNSEVEKKQENDKQLDQDKKIEKKTTIVLKKSKLDQKTTTRKNNTITKYKQQVQNKRQD